MYTIYENFEELLADKKELANELVEERGKGEWQEEEIYYYEDEEEFAEYELTEGWYADNNLDRDYNGAPNLLDFIDYQSLGEALTNTWDESCNFLATSGEILTTGYGW